MELTINDEVYSFRFGIAFMRELDQKHTVKTPTGIDQPAGFAVAVAGIMDGNVSDLCEALLVANKTESKKISRNKLEDYIDDENTDIDALFKETVSFLSKSNACRNQIRKMQTLIDATKDKDDVILYPTNVE